MASHWLEHVGAEVITHLSDRWVVRHVAAGSTILRPGAAALGVCFVLSGTLRVQVATGTPTPVTLALVGPGEIVGELSMFHGGRRTANVVASEPCELLVLGRRAFLGLIEQHPRVAVGLLKALSARIAELTEQLSDFALRALPVRLARRLLDLADIYGGPTPEGLRIDARISQQDLAGWVGTTREAVNKHLRAWEDQGLLRLDRVAITIVRRGELERLARGRSDGEAE